MLNSGDVVAYRGNSVISSIVHWWTESPYSHIGVIWKIKDQLFFVEALIFKGVRIIPIDKLPANYDVVKTQVTLLGEAEAFILQHLADDYSLIDAIRAGLGLKQKDHTGWQCAEFAAQILKRCGLRLPERENLTPIELITLIKQGA
ncbi:hypothetical protein [Piscirickettsia salmonis]|uniref:hypothetical protein n=1 Tax=Piscirickettsia salmonis TaxID=1238 RepID=UPI00031EE295|nr:hypothetical protein [Piscirickettsia salmonis]ERL61441.1 hypothetical protein K661_02220 [Piscirickettsia salmonis LF-89 = ATCC VR-1361]PEQ16913.1 hypothetical protein X973_04900 [Piscirickettsia salmonis]QGN79217.1 hypothetical protein Psal001_03482 [Piscirickettsia salmonis]QGN82808.1 hypothetical protein Psal002_03508 [Piscirickettsia salmonis]QGN86320.1 hypothetical protein Psal003_03429 [Piscirickettsia salmonis]